MKRNIAGLDGYTLAVTLCARFASTNVRTGSYRISKLQLSLA